MIRIDCAPQMIQLYSYKLPTVKIGNWIMDFRIYKKIKQIPFIMERW